MTETWNDIRCAEKGSTPSESMRECVSCLGCAFSL